jgi:hypothetical protein
MPRDDLEESFPGLRTAEYRVTSPPDANYNCVAWAAGDSQRWWDPALEPGYFWPPRIARTLTLANLVQLWRHSVSSQVLMTAWNPSLRSW